MTNINPTALSKLIVISTTRLNAMQAHSNANGLDDLNLNGGKNMNSSYIVATDDIGNEAVWSLLSDGTYGWTFDPPSMVRVRQEDAQRLLDEIRHSFVGEFDMRVVCAIGVGLDMLEVVNSRGETIRRVLE